MINNNTVGPTVYTLLDKSKTSLLLSCARNGWFDMMQVGRQEV